MTDTSTPAVLDLASRFEAACERIGDGQPNRISDLLRALVRERDALRECMSGLVEHAGADHYRYLDKGIGTGTFAGEWWLKARALSREP